MEYSLTFDDISLIPAVFSEISSRKDVNTTLELFGNKVFPLISSNMDSVYSPELSKEVLNNGAISIVHRFCSLQENINLFLQGCTPTKKPWVSVGLGSNEWERFISLERAGAEVFLIDVAQGANRQVADQFIKIYDYLLEHNKSTNIIVGNFDNSEQIEAFIFNVDGRIPAAFKCGIGGGSVCSTRVVTGVGTPSITALIDCVQTGYPIIWDGGIKTPGDFCKAIALGAQGVISGKLFAQCEESGAQKITKNEPTGNLLTYSKPMFINNDGSIQYVSAPFAHESKEVPKQVIYKGSASYDSYTVQGKHSSHRTPEGESTILPVTGKVQDLIQTYDAGLRSSMSYLNAKTVLEYQENCAWQVISQASAIESTPHGKK